MQPILQTIANRPPSGGHRLRVARLGASREFPLADVYLAATRVAEQLLRLGVQRGDRVGILAGNCLEWVVLDLAALRIGAVTAGFEPGKFSPDGDLVERYGLTVLFTDHPAEGARVRPIDDIGELLAMPAASTPIPPISYAPHDITAIKFTSGSSGPPKGLEVRADSIASTMDAVQRLLGHTAEDDLFVFLPLSLLQQRYWIYSALYYGHDVTICTYEAAFPSLAQCRPTVVMGVPAFYETALRHIEARAQQRAGADRGALPAARRSAAQRLFGDRIRYLWSGSAPTRPDLLAYYAEIDLTLYEGYGLNETCIVSKNGPGAHRPGSVGRVLPGKQVIIDAAGRIRVHSDAPVNDRYAYAPPGTSERVFLGDGVVRTGDLGYLDQDGYLYIRGRADDVIVLDNGKKIIVRPIEEALRAHPAIEECLVYAATPTLLAALISPAQDPPDAAAIMRHVDRCNHALERDEQLAGVVLADPAFRADPDSLGSQGKPRRAALFERYRDQLRAACGAQRLAASG